MTNQPLPNRRFRRLLPATLAAVTLASSAPFFAPGVSHADTKPKAAPPAHVRVVALPRTEAIRGVKVQGNSAT